MQAGFPIVLKPHDDADLTEKKARPAFAGPGQFRGMPRQLGAILVWHGRCDGAVT
jgi:hypothetical protein